MHLSSEAKDELTTLLITHELNKLSEKDLREKLVVLLRNELSKWDDAALISAIGNAGEQNYDNIKKMLSGMEGVNDVLKQHFHPRPKQTPVGFG